MPLLSVLHNSVLPTKGRGATWVCTGWLPIHDLCIEDVANCIYTRLNLIMDSCCCWSSCKRRGRESKLGVAQGENTSHCSRQVFWCAPYTQPLWLCPIRTHIDRKCDHASSASPCWSARCTLPGFLYGVALLVWY